jgi:hypothetical protein
MTGQEYEAPDLEVLAYREAVLRRPGMFFEPGPRSTWPLVMLAWTAIDLMMRAGSSQHIVEAAVLRDGRFKVSVRDATVFRPGIARTLEETVRLAQLWSGLNRSTVVVVSGGDEEALPGVSSDDHRPRTFAGVDISILVECDSDLLGSGPGDWWQGWIDRVPAVLTTAGLARYGGGPIVAFDESSGQRVTIGEQPVAG